MNRLTFTLAAALAVLSFQCGTASGPAISAEDIAANNRGVGLMGYFDYQAAHDLFQTLTAKRPDWVPVQINLAIATLNLQTEGSEKRALDILEAVLAKEPGNLRALYCSALLNLFLGETAVAKARFQQVVDGDPQDAYALYYLGQCTAREGDHETALALYQRAAEAQPYLRSAYYGMFQSCQRLGLQERARETLALFQKLEANPQARQVEIKYTRMGPKAEAQAVGDPAPIAKPPQGALFAAAEPLAALPEGVSWRPLDDGRAPGVSACDLDRDGDLDLFAAGVLDTASGPRNGVFLNRDGRFEAALDHPLAMVSAVNAALFGDLDNDGVVDAYLCRAGPNQLWRQDESGAWTEVSAATQTAGGDRDTVDGLWLDADHDGDLDLYLVNGDGPNELLNNNLDGTFRPLGAERGVDGGPAGSRAVVAADLDKDRDVDLVVINREPPHAVYLNDRLWQYRTAAGFDDFAARDIIAAVAGDGDADGQTELYALQADGALVRWQPGADRVWTGETLQEGVGAGALAYLDIDGSGTMATLYSGANGWPAAGDDDGAGGSVRHWTPVVLDGGKGPALVGVAGDGALSLRRPGPGRYPFVALQFTGKEDRANSMRSNAMGVGAAFAVRVGARWSAASSFPGYSGPGQSLQPTAIGLGGADKLDFVAITWSDGVFQTELDLAVGQTHVIRETQRQLSSCPVLFAWNGQEFAFVSDVLGVGGIGFAVGPGEYSQPRPWENFLLPQGALAPRDGRYALRITEPMEEAAYLDRIGMAAYDLPPGWRMTLDERMGVSAPKPTGEPRFYRRALTPSAAVNDRGQDVLADIAERDGRAAPIPALDSRFIGLLATEHQLNVAFPKPIDSGGGEPMLVIDGWVEYPYSQTSFAAWQAGESYRAPSLWARAAGGEWRLVYAQFGYPAGMPRQMSVPLTGLPEGAVELRLTGNLEIYWDRLFIAYAEPCPQARRLPMSLAGAVLEPLGFAKRTNGPQRRPHYDDSRRAPFWDTRHQRGFYTAFGDVAPLLAEADDAQAIFGPGEGVTLSFEPPAAAASRGWTRRFVLETEGWCKDMDLYTRDGETLAPLPQTGKPAAARDALRQRFNTRYQSGR